MNFLFNIFIIALIAKAFTLSLFFILPHFGVDHKPSYEINLYKSYPVVRAFKLSLRKQRPKKVIKKPVYKLNNIKLKAIYSEGKNGVIAIEEKRKIIFLSTGEFFKGYRLIEVKSSSAVFEKGGKHYVVNLQEQPLVNKFFIYQEKPQIPSKVSVLKRQIHQYKKNFSAIWKNISIQEQIDPVTKRLQGFKVTNIKKNSIFAKLGLQKGDIIIGANNKIFHSYSDVLKIYNRIEKLNSLKLTIIRNNRKKDIEYEIY